MSAGKTNFADDMLNAQITDEAELQHKYGEDIPSYDTEALARMGARGSTSIFCRIRPAIEIFGGNCHRSVAVEIA